MPPDKIINDHNIQKVASIGYFYVTSHVLKTGDRYQRYITVLGKKFLNFI